MPVLSHLRAASGRHEKRSNRKSDQKVQKKHTHSPSNVNVDAFSINGVAFVRRFCANARWIKQNYKFLYAMTTSRFLLIKTAFTHAVGGEQMQVKQTLHAEMPVNKIGHLHHSEHSYRPTASTMWECTRRTFWTSYISAKNSCSVLKWIK